MNTVYYNRSLTKEEIFAQYSGMSRFRSKGDQRTNCVIISETDDKLTLKFYSVRIWTPQWMPDPNNPGQWTTRRYERGGGGSFSVLRTTEPKKPYISSVKGPTTFILKDKNGKLEVLCSNASRGTVNTYTYKLQLFFWSLEQTLKDTDHPVFNSVEFEFVYPHIMRFLKEHWNVDESTLRTAGFNNRQNAIASTMDMMRKVVYPWLKEPITEMSNIPAIVARSLRSDNLMEMNKDLLGRKATRVTARALAAALLNHPGESTWDGLLLARLLRDILQPDQIAKLLPITFQGSRYHLPLDAMYGFTMLMRCYPPQRIVKLLTEARTSYEVHDLGSMFKELRALGPIPIPQKPKSITELHDFYAILQRKLASDNKPIGPGPLEGIQYAVLPHGIRIELPTCTWDMLEWGEKMHHCIFSYASHAVSGAHTFGAVYQHGQLLGNFDVSIQGRALKMVQFLGQYNKPVPEEPRQIVENLLAEEYDVNVSDYWGREQRNF